MKTIELVFSELLLMALYVILGRPAAIAIASVGHALDASIFGGTGAGHADFQGVSEEIPL